MSMLEGGRGWFITSRVESMSIMSLIGGKTVGKLDEVGSCEVTTVERVVITKLTTTVSVVGLLRYLSSSAPHSSPYSSLAAEGNTWLG